MPKDTLLVNLSDRAVNKPETPKQIAERLVERMFTNGSDNKADRLVLVREDGSSRARVTNALDLGGWSREPLIDLVEDEIKAERERCAERAEQARLPRGYQYGREAMANFDFGKERAAAAIRGGRK